MSDRLLHTLAALKVVAYGGPVAMAMSTVGAMFLGWAFWDRAGEHYDVAIILGAIGVVLGFVEWALARRFHAHEEVERRQYQHVASIADTAAEALGAMTKATREHTAAVEGFRVETRATRDDINSLARRVAAIEDRYMRPGLVLPRKPEEPK